MSTMLDRDVLPEVKLLEEESAGGKSLVRGMYDRFLKRVGGSRAPKGDGRKEMTIDMDAPLIDKIEAVRPPGVVEVPAPSIEGIKMSGKPPVKERVVKTDKGSYESVTTNNYFEDYNDLELGGNVGIKDKIRENIVRAEASNVRIYGECAKAMGISDEEFKERLQAKVEEMVGKSDFFVAVRLSVFERIMGGDGRWRSQFETGSSNGHLNPSYRATAEKRMFGFNESDFPKPVESTWDDGRRDREATRDAIEHNKEMRPIYGYFSDDAHGAINSRGRIPPENAVSQYGNINVKLKRDRVLWRTTITFHDSLGKEFDWPPTPAAKPHFTSAALRYSLGREILENSKGPSMVNWGESYTEAQYHGQLTLDDVESICVSRENGVYADDIDVIRQIFGKYKLEHPESTIQLIEF